MSTRHDDHDNHDRPFSPLIRRTLSYGFDAVVTKLVEELRPSKEEHDLRLASFACLQKVIEKTWPGARVKLFGSMKTCLYLPDGWVFVVRVFSAARTYKPKHFRSDLDVVVLHPGLAPKFMHSHLTALRESLVKCHFATRDQIKLISNAKVPIVKFCSSPQFGSFYFDVSFNELGGPEGNRKCRDLLQELDIRPASEASPSRDLFACLHYYVYHLSYAQDQISTKWGGLVPKPPPAPRSDPCLTKTAYLWPACQNAHHHLTTTFTSLSSFSSDDQSAYLRSSLSSLGFDLSPEMFVARQIATTNIASGKLGELAEGFEAPGVEAANLDDLSKTGGSGQGQGMSRRVWKKQDQGKRQLGAKGNGGGKGGGGGMMMNGKGLPFLTKGQRKYQNGEKAVEVTAA
ncbi:hypothetical protein JCM11641_000838, partial [Rhodosporidiobolus odoratus]